MRELPESAKSSREKTDVESDGGSADLHPDSPEHEPNAESAVPLLVDRDFHRLLIIATGCLTLLLIVLGGLAIYQIEEWGRTIPYIAFLIAQYLIVRHVTTRYGHRFVTIVLAVKAVVE